MSNLYELPLDGATFVRQCGGNLDSDNESCIDLAEIPGTNDGFALRDSKPEGAGHELRMTGNELNAFALNWVKSRGLTV